MSTSAGDNVDRLPAKAPLGSIPTTPLRHSSAGSSQHSSQRHSNTASQKELQETLRFELSGATFESKKLSDPIPISPKIINEIKKRLPSWPPDGKESTYYEPVLKTINAVRDVLKKSRGPEEPKAVYDNHGLFVYAERAVIDTVEGAHPLKPDLILARRTELGENEGVRWRDLDAVIEVKRDWPDLVTQAATYARALFHSNATRSFALVIGVNHKTRRARFMFFHRGGLTSTPELAMDGDEPGFSEFVQMVYTVFSWKKPEDAGFLSALSEDGPFGDVMFLSGRTCIRGRANQVGILSQKENTEPRNLEAPSPQPNDPPLRRSKRLAKASARQAQNRPLPPSTTKLLTLAKGKASLPREAVTQSIASPRDHSRIATGKNVLVHDHDACANAKEALADAIAAYEYGNPKYANDEAERRLPPRLVCKDSWPLASDADIEIDTYAPVYNEFGVPKHFASQRLGDNKRFVDGATPWNIFGEEFTLREPELRVHVRLYYSTVGKPLDTCQTLYELLECILHAMIGHFNVLRKSHALHRDVSEGNILRVDKAATGIEVFDELFGSNLQHIPATCHGILIDGDLAKRIGDREPPVEGESISGTLPYMSINLLSQWTAKNPIYHNPNDDLESGAWVAMVCGLEQSTKYDASNRERSWLARLLSLRLDSVSAAKLEIRELDHTWTQFPPPKLHAFYGLIGKWLALLWKRATADNFGAEGSISKERYIESYREFLIEGLNWLSTRAAELRQNWQEFFSSQRENVPSHW